MIDRERFPVPCPRDYCGATTGEPCRSAMGNVTLTHTPRKDAAKAKGLTCGSLTVDEVRAQTREKRMAARRPGRQGEMGL